MYIYIYVYIYIYIYDYIRNNSPQRPPFAPQFTWGRMGWGGIEWGGDVNVPSAMFPGPCTRC